jgi:hypothetical protein
LKYTEGFDSKQNGAALTNDYEITWKGERLLSIQFIGYKNTPDAAYPSSFAYSENIDINTGDEVKLSDMVQAEGSFASLLMEKSDIKYLYFDQSRSLKNDESFREPQQSQSIKDYVFKTEVPVNFSKADSADNATISSYFTEDSLGLVFETIHAFGDHIEFEIKYKDIQDYMIKDNSLWEDFPEAMQETASADITPTKEPEQETVDINEDEIIKNTNYVPGFSIIKDQSFWVDLENWGKVYFLSASGEGEFSLDSLYMYLVDKDNNILYEFPYFYGNGMMFSGMRAVAFKDVNKDGFKDIIVIAAYMTGIGPTGAEEYPVAGIYFQKGKEFVTLPELDEEINSSGKNETVDMVTKYLEGINIPTIN